MLGFFEALTLVFVYKMVIDMWLILLILGAMVISVSLALIFYFVFDIYDKDGDYNK